MFFLHKKTCRTAGWEKKKDLQAYKPSSVRARRALRSHLSGMHVAMHFKLPLRRDGRPWRLLCGIAPNRVYTAGGVAIAPVSSYLAFSSLPGGCFFLLHFPGGCPRRTLSVILAHGSSDFPQEEPFGALPRLRGLQIVSSYAAYMPYATVNYIILYPFCQPPCLKILKSAQNVFIYVRKIYLRN